MEKSFSERVTEAKTAVSPIGPREAANLREGCEPVLFIDPRPSDVIAATTGLIPGAHCVALADITSGALPTVLSDKWAKVITTCQAGPMAAVAAHELMKQGFARVAYLEGGTQAWLAAGLSTVR